MEKKNEERTRPFFCDVMCNVSRHTYHTEYMKQGIQQERREHKKENSRDVDDHVQKYHIVWLCVLFACYYRIYMYKQERYTGNTKNWLQNSPRQEFTCT